jgi:hypothetical protein
LKRIACIILAIAITLASSACAGKKQDKELPADNENTYSDNTTTAAVTQTAPQTSVEATTAVVASSPENTTQDTENKEKIQLLQSASVDLDGDGSNEQVEALQVTIKRQTEGEPDELEGRIKITGKKGTVEIPFIKKQAGLSGVMTSFDFKDLDGDGAKDVFIVIPDNGAAFSLNYFFIYSYKTKKSYSFNTDSSLSEFAGGFKFNYKGKGLLEMSNEGYKFSSVFDINSDYGIDPMDENNKSYDRSWVEPTPVEISETSRLALVNAGNGINEIKVPLPVFGLATVDMIGEIDLYYQVDSTCQPVLKHFDVIDFNEGGNKKIGEYKIK